MSANFADAETIANLQRKNRRAKLWFKIWVILLIAAPIQWVLLFLLSMLPRSPIVFGISALMGFASSIGAIIALAGLMLMWNDRSRWTNALGRATLAEKLGGTFDESASPTRFAIVHAFGMFPPPTKENVKNFVEGDIDGMRSIVADYYWSKQDWGELEYLNTTIVVLRDAVGNCPDLAIVPRGFMSGMLEKLGLAKAPIAFPGDFGKRFLVDGPKKDAAANRVTAAVQDFCLGKPDVVVLTHAGMLLAHKNKVLAADDTQALFDNAIAVAKLLRA